MEISSYENATGYVLQAKSLSFPSLAPNPFRICTSEKCARNPFRIHTSKIQDLKPFRMNTYEKTPRGEGATAPAPNTRPQEASRVTLCDFNGFRFIKFGKLTHVGAP
jgi:hypothetical protein